MEMIQMEQGDQVPFCSVFEVLLLQWPEFSALLTFNIYDLATYLNPIDLLCQDLEDIS